MTGKDRIQMLFGAVKNREPELLQGLDKIRIRDKIIDGLFDPRISAAELWELVKRADFYAGWSYILDSPKWGRKWSAAMDQLEAEAAAEGAGRSASANRVASRYLGTDTRTAASKLLYDRFNEAMDAWLTEVGKTAEKLSKNSAVAISLSSVGGGFLTLGVDPAEGNSPKGVLTIFFPGGEYGEVVFEWKPDSDTPDKPIKGRWTVIAQNPESMYHQFLKRMFGS